VYSTVAGSSTVASAAATALLSPLDVCEQYMQLHEQRTL
jgi:hypothetical protein